MAKKNLLDRSLTSEIDYVFLLYLLREYHFPRNKIQSFLKNKDLIRVKKGLYVRSDKPYSLGVLANMIYGPSYVSQEFALARYGMIPERVYHVTSMTIGRRKEFNTLLGSFYYESIQKDLFSLGLQHVVESPTQSFLIASPEKALIDLIVKRKDLSSEQDVSDFLIYDLRIDLDSLSLISSKKFKKIASFYTQPVISTLANFISKQKKVL